MKIELNQAEVSLSQMNLSQSSFSDVLTATEWDQETIKMYGKVINVPRLTAWYGTQDYTYSGIHHEARELPAEIQAIKDEVEERTGQKFNSCLLNLYRDGSDSVSWHTDLEDGLGEDPTIASVSLGATRNFCLKHKTDKSDKVKMQADHGSLIVMGRGSQLNYLHSVPKTKKSVNERINITFRNMI